MADKSGSKTELSRTDGPHELSLLPSVDELLGSEASQRLIPELGWERVVALARSVISARRERILARDGGVGSISVGVTREGYLAELSDELASLGRSEADSHVRRVINATGVVIHTNLGRAPLSAAAVTAMSEAAGYSTIEYDVEKGGRGSRGPRAVSLLKDLTGAEDALVVNNCAAAALLTLSVFAQGREVIVSRGELVEIGGDFRIPDVLTRSGAVLREVGTTNRTHLRDYEEAISERTAMILKVHPSNYRITGFTKTPGTDELTALAHERGLLFYEDAGSGALIDLAPYGIKGEPVIREVLAAGADIVSFSGDKLLGGPQAGILVGRADLIGRLRKDPFYRALRVDKTITAALEATLSSYSAGRPVEELPVVRMLSIDASQIRLRSERFVNALDSETGGGLLLHAELTEGVSAVGGGASPDAALGTTLIVLRHPEMSESELEKELRNAETPVIARIEAGRVLIDLRTLSEGEEVDLIATLGSIARGDRSRR
jgi:L-seryl-tRNA(Ser) seleniumtransferase